MQNWFSKTYSSRLLRPKVSAAALGQKVLSILLLQDSSQGHVFPQSFPDNQSGSLLCYRIHVDCSHGAYDSLGLLAYYLSPPFKLNPMRDKRDFLMASVFIHADPSSEKSFLPFTWWILIHPSNSHWNASLLWKLLCLSLPRLVMPSSVLKLQLELAPTNILSSPSDWYLPLSALGGCLFRNFFSFHHATPSPSAWSSNPTPSWIDSCETCISPGLSDMYICAC